MSPEDPEKLDTMRDGPSLPDDVVAWTKSETIAGVGYGQPPRHRQFRKGQSGNPKGRPSRRLGTTPADEMLEIDRVRLKESRRMVKVKEGGRVAEVSASEALVKAQINAGLRGSAYAARHALAEIREAEEQERREIEKSQDLWRWYLDECQDKTDEARRKGLPRPEFLPSPDDVILEPNRPVRIAGPINQEELRRVAELCRVRDALLLQAEMERRLSAGTTVSTADVLAQTMNNLLPRRWRLDEIGLLRGMMRNETRTMRELLRETYRSWRDLGVRVKRGRTLPLLDQYLPLIRLVFALVDGHREGRIQLEAMARGDFDEEAAALIGRYIGGDRIG